MMQTLSIMTSKLLHLVVLLLIFPSVFEASKGKKTQEVLEKESVWITGNTTHYQNAFTTSAGVVKIGSFNLKQFGAKKSKNEDVLKILAKIVCRYELIALQEITDVKENSVKKLLDAESHESSHPYHFVGSPRVGRTKQKEQYGLIFRPDIFQVKRQIIFDDSVINDGFSREPQIAEIIIKQTGQKFVIINVHVAPKNASVEINFLRNVHTWVKEKWRTGNIIILGDLNADCDYLRKKDLPNITLLNDPKKYTLLIPTGVDTTVGNTKCTYDRIIVSGPLLKRTVVPDSASTFEFDREYRLDQNEALRVSDHYPVHFSMAIGNGASVTPNDEPERIQTSSTRRNSLQEITNLVIMCNIFFRMVV